MQVALLWPMICCMELAWLTGTMPVSYSGGVFNIGAPILNPLEALLARHSMALVAPKLPPDKGAVVLAFQHDNAPIPEGLMM